MSLRLTKAQAKQLGIDKVSTHTLSEKQVRNKALLKQSAKRGQEPQLILSHACKARWPECVEEYKGAIPGRKFRLDIAFPHHKLCLEFDGWQWHGKYLEDFKKDRERQNLLTIHGWRILRFTATDVRQNLMTTLDTIQTCLDNIEQDIHSFPK